jgi:hypothetical protein
MFYRKVPGVVITCGVAAVLLGMPAESSACCDWLFGGWGARTTYRLPYFAQAYTPVYTSVSAPQTVRYVPQTCYRTVYQRVPVTACRAVTYSDPCTGCPVTAYRPVTSWTYQARLVPYTTYRLIYSNAYSPYVSYSSCWPYGATVGTFLGAAGSCCTAGASGAVSSGTAPYSGPSGSPTAPPAETIPRPKTFIQEPNSSNGSLKATPDPNTSSMPEPDLIGPGNRTTSRPAHPTVSYRLVTSPPEPAVVQPVRTDEGGWRASRD